MARFSVLGDGMLDRARSIALALLALTAGVCFALVAVVAQQGWPLLPGSPIPGLPDRTGRVHKAVVAPGAPRDGRASSAEEATVQSGGGAATATPGGGAGGSLADQGSGSRSSDPVASPPQLTGSQHGRSPSRPNRHPSANPPSAAPTPVPTPVAAPATTPEPAPVAPEAAPSESAGGGNGNGARGNGNGNGNGNGFGRSNGNGDGNGSAKSTGEVSGSGSGSRSSGSADAGVRSAGSRRAVTGRGSTPRSSKGSRTAKERYGIPVSTGKPKGSSMAVASRAVEEPDLDGGAGGGAPSSGRSGESHGKGNAHGH